VGWFANEPNTPLKEGYVRCGPLKNLVFDWFKFNLKRVKPFKA